MLSAREVGLVAQREILRNIRSTKGIAMFALFFLGGLVPAVVRLLISKLTDDVPEEILRRGFEKYLSTRYDDAVAKHVVDAPSILYFLYEGTVMFLPLLVLLVGFDQIAGEVQHRTIRYSAGRATRPSIVAGKALGIWGVVAIMISVLHLTVWLVTLAQGGTGAGAVFGWGIRFTLFSIVCAAAYVGFTSLMSSLFRTPTVSLFAGAGAGFALWLSYTLMRGLVGLAERVDEAIKAGTPGAADAWQPPAGLVKVIDSFTWLYPNRYERLLVSPDPLSLVTGLGLFVLWGSVCVAIASFIVSRRDV